MQQLLFLKEQTGAHLAGIPVVLNPCFSKTCLSPFASPVPVIIFCDFPANSGWALFIGITVSFFFFELEVYTLPSFRYKSRYVASYYSVRVLERSWATHCTCIPNLPTTPNCLDTCVTTLLSTLDPPATIGRRRRDGARQRPTRLLVGKELKARRQHHTAAEEAQGRRRSGMRRTRVYWG